MTQPFIKHVKPDNYNKVCLILDTHDGHITNKPVMLVQKNGILMFTFPPHTNHQLQLIDKTIFGLKKYYNKVCNDWIWQGQVHLLYIMSPKWI